ncbi:MAG TPA: polysaccharide biosynthesis protein [Candidatus Dormibacteraeota bacterium]|nr:polysaccharide biosynthesis protein [Candidatus Dormibacteraeota bacterium]
MSGQETLKRGFDIVLSAIGLILLSPLLLVIAVMVKLDSPGPAIHRGIRVGRNQKNFRIYKFRSMTVAPIKTGPKVTAADDPRITRTGRLLRRTKLDELPQLLNVLRGEMSIVGPRPEDPEFVALYSEDQLRLLGLRPGITSPASLAFHDEEALLNWSDAQREYTDNLLQHKLALEVEYLDDHSFAGDLVIVVRTIDVILGRDSNLMQWLARSLRRHLPWVVIDAPIVALSFYAALLLRFTYASSGAQRAALHGVTLAILPVIALYLVSNYVWGLDRRVWRYATAPEVIAILVSVATATILGLVIDAAIGFSGVRPLPLSLIGVGGFFSFCGMVAVRYRFRLLRGLRRTQKGALDERRPALIYGAGEAGQFLAWRLLTERDGRSYRMIGFIDDDRSKHGLSIHGIRVLGGRRDLPRLVQAHSVELIILAISNIAGEDLRAIISAAQETTAQIRIVPNLYDLVSDPTTHPLLREVRVEDLLGRQPAMIDVDACERVLANKTVLVTGGCGSVGSELCRQIVAFEPVHLVVYDNNETGLFDLELELRSIAPRLRMTLMVGDVADESKMRRVFDETEPQVIFHAAAYKHVPLMELYPEEAVRVNVKGTMLALDNAARIGAEFFVLVSTDKAVHPRSVMGATKRIAELLLLETALRTHAKRPTEGEDEATLFTAVRFGNVLGSRGSVVPTFARQISMGGPVTVTHPDMTRYFMDVSEAASLIIQAAGLTDGGDIFMLDMGERIKVDDLARKMIRMRGLRPDLDIPIVYTGIRPGEKLHEELLMSAEERLATGHPLICSVRGSKLAPRLSLRRRALALLELANDGRREDLVKALMRLARQEPESKRDSVLHQTVVVELPLDRPETASPTG